MATEASPPHRIANMSHERDERPVEGPECGGTANVEWEHLPPAVCVVVVHQGASGDQPRVLLIRRAKPDVGFGYWTPITGKLEVGESFADAVVRETREEVGLDVMPRGGPVWRCPTSIRSHLLSWFLATPAAESPRSTRPKAEPSAPPALPASPVLPGLICAPEEVLEARWVPLAEAPALDPMFADTRRFLQFAAAHGLEGP